MLLKVLQENKDWIVIHKPAGMLVESNPYETSVEDILKNKYPFVGIVHRLDRVTNGVLLLAKKKSSLKKLNKQFNDRIVDKEYLALVNKKPFKEEDELIHQLVKDQKNKKAIIVSEPTKKSFKVSLQYKFISKEKGNYLLKIHPKTGKFHQIRAQLAFMGCPILGDTKYDHSENKDHLKKIALQASSLSFIDTVSNEKVEIKTEENIWE